jgi:outer membrane immunogenic protein
MMKKIAGVAIVVAALQLPAFAADMPVKAASAPAPAISDWSGFYVGAEGGGGWVRSHMTFFFPTTTSTTNGDGGFAGGTLGYNWQSGPWVFGVEGDWSWADLRGKEDNINPNCTAGGIGTCFAKLKSFETARARLGYAVSTGLLAYVTGGAAFGEISSGSQNAASNLVAHDHTNTGWTIGGGLEAQLAPNWSAKVEYQYVDLGSTGVLVDAAAGSSWQVDRFQTHLVRVGLNYRFGH